MSIIIIICILINTKQVISQGCFNKTQISISDTYTYTYTCCGMMYNQDTQWLCDNTFYVPGHISFTPGILKNTECNENYLGICKFGRNSINDTWIYYHDNQYTKISQIVDDCEFAEGTFVFLNGQSQSQSNSSSKNKINYDLIK
jgi:hypothetical protein